MNNKLNKALKSICIFSILCLTAACGSDESNITPTDSSESGGSGIVTTLRQSDFTYGTYIIDRPGTYRLTEDISFNPNSTQALTEAIADGTLTSNVIAALDLPTQVDAYYSGAPLFTQFKTDGSASSSTNSLTDPQYDPAAFGLGFFAAIVIAADNVTLDLNDHTIEQSAEHALLQRFFAVIELADKPFIPTQGPHNFGATITSATNTTITNGTIGRSSHHGIHGNGNSNITVENVDFVDFEVAAIALNGVQGLNVESATATNRKDVPVIGTFSSAQFIKPYINELYRNETDVTLRVQGEELNISDIRTALKDAIINTHNDLIASPFTDDNDRITINPTSNPDEYALFHNVHGVVDGNSYGFLINHLGVAVFGFPNRPDGETIIPARNIFFNDVHINSQHAFINEIVAINNDNNPVRDPVGAIFQIHNLDTNGDPITISSTASDARYTGNVVANAQAFVAKAFYEGEFENSNLDLNRLTINETHLNWVEGRSGFEALSSIIVGNGYLCNGDSMFHVNKGVIGFKMDAGEDITMVDTSANDLYNIGKVGSTLCGDYSETISHPKANLPGYGGARTRAYSFAGSTDVVVRSSNAQGIDALAGDSIGLDVMTDSTTVTITRADVTDIDAGEETDFPAPNETPNAVGIQVSANATDTTASNVCVRTLAGPGNLLESNDLSNTASIDVNCSDEEDE